MRGREGLRPRRRLSAVLLVLCTAWAASTHPNAQTPGRSAEVLVFAASSLQTALDALTPRITAATGVRVRISYAASSALARQLEAGAPADLFVSADEDWMDYVQARGSVRIGSRVALLGNRLVLIAPAQTPTRLTIGPGFDLAGALGRGRLAVADPAVPAGKYARAALETLRVWPSVSGHLAATENVRAALLLVARGESPLGIVYLTDALADRRVTVVDTFPASSHPPIVYPAALTARAPAEAARVLAYLQTAEARAVFAAQGFLTATGDR